MNDQVANASIAIGAAAIAQEEKEVDPFGTCRSVHHYQKIGRIGEGTYGYVYKALDKEKDNAPVALKRIILHNEEHDGFPLTSIREIQTLRKCQQCPYVVQLLDVVVGKSRDAVFLTFEYCEHDLSNIMKRIDHPFRESEVKTLALQLLQAVEFLHSKWIVHRDIKLSNLLYTKKGQLKVADFGLARQLSVPVPSDLTPVVMTLWYRAPEVLLELGHYSFAVDCWSIGCILAELLDARPLFDGNSEVETVDSIFRLLGAPSERIWPEIVNAKLIRVDAIDLREAQRRYPYNLLSDRFTHLSREGLDLLQRLLTFRPRHRMTARDAASHTYFHVSPYPTAEDFMPTFPSFHEDDVREQKRRRILQSQSSHSNQPGQYNRRNSSSTSTQYGTNNAQILSGEKRPFDSIFKGSGTRKSY
jgi:serine/threonine protein kinase